MSVEKALLKFDRNDANHPRLGILDVNDDNVVVAVVWLFMIDIDVVLRSIHPRICRARA